MRNRLARRRRHQDDLPGCAGLGAARCAPRAGAWFGTPPRRLAVEREDAVWAIAERCGYSPPAANEPSRPATGTLTNESSAGAARGGSSSDIGRRPARAAWRCGPSKPQKHNQRHGRHEAPLDGSPLEDIPELTVIVSSRWRPVSGLDPGGGG